MTKVRFKLPAPPAAREFELSTGQAKVEALSPDAVAVVLGSPASGKTTAVRALVQSSLARGLQADQIFSSNLARLQRDYEGIILYRKLLAQNMLSRPYVSQADLGVTGGGDDMRINDRVLRITAISQLQPNIKQWNPVIAK